MGEWLENLDWQVSEGDILQQEADAIVCLIKDTLEPYGSLGPKLFQRLGSDRFADALRQKCLSDRGGPRLKLGEAIAVPIDRGYSVLRYRFAIMCAIWSSENAYTQDLVYRLFSSVFGEIRRHTMIRVVSVIPQVGDERSGGQSILDLALLQVLRENDCLTRPPLWSNCFSFLTARSRSNAFGDFLRRAFELYGRSELPLWSKKASRISLLVPAG